MTTSETAHTASALALHRELVRQVPAGMNLPWSPYSVASALGLVAAGARGDTYAQLLRALTGGGSAGEPVDLAQLGRMLADAAVLPDAEAAVANSLWMDGQRLRVTDDYQRAVLGWPGGAVHTTDFAGDPDGSREKINADVAEATRQLVRDLIAPGLITRETAAVIVNALYLKVAWQSPFEASATAPAPFHAPSGTRAVATMHQQERLRYASAGGWRMVTLPTASDVVVDVLLPERPDGGEEAPEPETLHELRSAGRMAKVDLALPKFRVEAAAVLNDCLRRLGVVAAFDAALADFSGIGSPPPVLDTVVHKAVLHVDEQGFEGAAATAVVMRMTSVDLSRPVPFPVDRPFLLVIRHQRSGAVYFLCRVTEP
jgi:serine protease inhibitor